MNRFEWNQKKQLTAYVFSMVDENPMYNTTLITNMSNNHVIIPYTTYIIYKVNFWEYSRLADHLGLRVLKHSRWEPLNFLSWSASSITLLQDLMLCCSFVLLETDSAVLMCCVQLYIQYLGWTAGCWLKWALISIAADQDLGQPSSMIATTTCDHWPCWPVNVVPCCSLVQAVHLSELRAISHRPIIIGHLFCSCTASSRDSWIVDAAVIIAGPCQLLDACVGLQPCKLSN